MQSCLLIEDTAVPNHVIVFICIQDESNPISD